MTHSPRPRRHPKGIRPHGSGWETYVRVNGEWRSEWWTADTPETTMQTWLAAQRQDRRLRSNTKTLRGMMPAYLEAVSAMPSFRDRKRDMDLWLAEFGDRSPHAISRLDVQAVLQRWELAGVAASTIRHRRSALSNFYATALPDAPNPARSAKAPAAPRPEPRGLPYALLETILEKMPNTGRGAKGGKRPNGSKTLARLRVLLWTGLPHAQIARIEPHHLDLDAGTVWVEPRRKGKGAAGRTLPLLPQAVEAFREFIRLGCFGAFSVSSVRQSFRRACKHVQRDLRRQGQIVDLSRTRVYDIRHSFLTQLAIASKDERAVQEMALHSDARMTKRYTEASVNPRLIAAVAAMARATRKI